MSLTISMPMGPNAGPYVAEAVRSVLNQTYKAIILVVTNDGEDATEAFEPLSDITDPRLVRFSLEANHGRYFCDCVVAYACDTEWFTVHDSDDWSELQRLQEMMHLAVRQHADVVPGAETIHGATTRIRRPLLRFPNRPLPHMWHLSALYQTRVFQAVIHPGFRVGYDSLMSAMLALTNLKIVPSNFPRYHRVAREGSLTKDARTGIGSEFRKQEIEGLTHLWQQVPRSPTLIDLSRIVSRSIHIQDTYAVEKEVDRLRSVLESRDRVKGET